MGYLVTKPFEMFLDSDGSPLENGYLYFGAVSQNPETNPIAIYWDADLTIPAANPVRTVNGYAARNGTPANLYTASNYSITVKDKNGRLVYNNQTSSALTGSASLINFSLTNQTVEAGATQGVDGITQLKTFSPVANRIIYLRYHTTAGDGGHGNFRAVTGAAPGTYVDNNGTIIVPTGGDGSAAWLRVLNGFVTPEMFGGTTEVAIQAAINAATDYMTVKFRGSYTITNSRVYVDSRNIIMDFGASSVTFSGNSTGFFLVGTISFFRSYGGEFIGDGINRDVYADSIYAQIAISAGPIGVYTSTKITNAIVDGGKFKNVNVGVRFYGIRGVYNAGTGVWDGQDFAESCTAVNCVFEDMIGYVGGFGYGLQFSSARNCRSSNNVFKRTRRHGLYFAEGDNFTSVGDEFYDHRTDGNPAELRGALTASRSTNISINGPIFENCYSALMINPEATYWPTANITVDSPVFRNCHLKYIVLGNADPVTHGVMRNVKIINPVISHSNVVSTDNLITIYSGEGVYLENVAIDDTAGNTNRIVFVSGAGGDAYTDDIRITGSINHTGGNGVYILTNVATGTGRILVDLDGVVLGSMIEYQTTPTNVNIITPKHSQSFTPTVIGLTTAGAGTYTTQTGYYVKKGNAVTFTANIVITNHTGTGNMEITGLPFASASSMYFPVAIYNSGLSVGAGSILIGMVLPGTTAIRLYAQSNTGIALVAMDTAFDIKITGTYLT